MTTTIFMKTLFSSFASINLICLPLQGFFELTQRSSGALNLASYVASRTKEKQAYRVVRLVCHAKRVQNN